ncbi:MAG TPA: MerR family transcriptional regulator [Pseudonocardiaceae bacterium]|nr:MerR family transcriptional regulator [Pseudonocardiaceae bacterium]
MLSNGLLTVGDLSRRTGVPVKTLRQYTDWGLIYSVGRSATNYRLFDAEALWCVNAIRQLRGLGLTLNEIRQLATAGEPFGPGLTERLRDSRARVTKRIDELRQTLQRLDDFEAGHLTLTPG